MWGSEYNDPAALCLEISWGTVGHLRAATVSWRTMHVHADELVAALRRIQLDVLERVRVSMRTESPETLSERSHETGGDVIYEIDRRVEDLIRDSFERELGHREGLLVICEGLRPDERMTLPRGLDPRDVERVVILDPIDGTRGLMYGKRSAWSLAASAPGPAPTLEDIDVAVQTEIPTLRSDLADQMWAVRGQGAQGVTLGLSDSSEIPLCFAPSQAPDLVDGFGMIARFFPPARDVLARLDDELMERVMGAAGHRATVFEDQYLCTGGQLQQLMTGRDRFIADLRGLVYDRREARGLGRGHDGHPYDVCTFLIAREAGVVICAPDGGPLDVPLDTTSAVSWAGYANAALRDLIEPHLVELLATL